MFTSLSSFTVIAFVLLCLAVLGAFLAGIWISARREGVDAFKRTLAVAGVLTLWILLTALPALSGWAEARPMPRVLLFIATVNLASLAAALSPVGRWLAAGVPIGCLVGFQAFRLPLELILHAWAQGGVIPKTMTWSGSNWDIVSGVAALTLAPLASRQRWAAWTANLIGLVLLANVMRVAVLSMPLPFAWPVTPPLQLPFHLPFVWILPICVGGALFGHVVLTRALLRPAGANPLAGQTS